MKLLNIKGDTYYIKGGTNTGVIKLDDKNVLLIDPGLGGLRPKNIIRLLDKNNMRVKYIINTHEHEDHYEGCSQMKEIDKNIQVLSSEDAKIYIDYPHKFSESILGGKSNIFLNTKVSEKKDNLTRVDKIISEGKFELNSSKVEIIKLKGHSDGSIGILTEDKVFFVGDLFVGSDIFNRFELLLINDIKSYLDSIEKIRNIDFEYMVLGHSKEIYSKDESEILIKLHGDSVNKYINQVRQLLKTPTTIDDILKNILNNNSNLSCNYTQYYFFRSTIMSIISYLCDLDEIDYSIKLGEMLYYSKKA